MGNPLDLSAEHILNSVNDGIYVTDLDRRIVFWNQSAERITGHLSEEVVGKTCFDGILMHSDMRGNTLCGEEHCPLHRSIVTGVSATCPLILFAHSPKGERIPLQVSVSPIRDKKGETVGGVEVFRDLSALLNDLDRAAAIQKSTMSSELPEDDRVDFSVRVIPLEYITGDYYRVEEIDKDRYGIFVADVSGHGVASALYTIELRTLIGGT